MKFLPKIKQNAKTGYLVIVLLFASLVLIACGGGGELKDSVNVAKDTLVNTVTSVVTPSVTVGTVTAPSAVTYKAGEKNSGGITYTSGDGSLLDLKGDDRITNSYGIPDRILTVINSMYVGTDTKSELKRESLIADSQFYTKILLLKNEQFPNNKEEAQVILYPTSAYTDFCKYRNAFSNSEVEEKDNRIYLANLDNSKKEKRYLEIQTLATVKYLGKNCK